MASDQLFELRRRTFNTPHFKGITFIEAEAKSIINHVPGNRLPFNYTINPYRGCSHACSYCQAGETSILMSDGRTRPLSDVRTGDSVYGTLRVGNYRRYVKTQVLDHWRTDKPAYRITLEDGTELIASGDHRFLSDRGWKHVIGAEQGIDRRPHLTVNSKLMGTGRFATGPEGGVEYRRGYLCGLIRGDGHLGSYSYERPGRRHGDVHRFRLALTDFEALRRATEYLKDGGIITQEFVFQEAVGAQKSMRAIRTSARAAVASIQELVLWPRATTDEWCKGFLAGIFDAEGSYGRGILRISNTDAAILDQIEVCLGRFGFPFVREVQPRGKPLSHVRVTGGVVQHLRFFHTVDPAITRKRSIEWQAIRNKAKLRVVSIEPLKTAAPLYDITTGTGDFIADGVVSHNCFARSTHTYLDLGPGRDFETKIFVKVNAPELLPKELRAKKWKGEHIAMGTATDPYQRAEGKYRIMPRIISTLTEFRNPFSILTKGTLILRDLDLLTEAARVMDVSTAFSIGTLDEDAWSKSEPGTPHPRKRMDAVRRLNEAGIPCGVMLAPILPGITDDPKQMRDVIKAAFDAGATHVSPILLHLRPYVKEVYIRWLEDNYPDLVPMYMSMYDRRSYARQSDRDKLTDTVDAIKKSLPRPKARYPTGFRWRPNDSESVPNSARSEQLSLI